MFGYPLEPDFDFAKEQRQQRVGWALLAGTGVCVIYDMAGLRFSLEVFQAFLATCLCFGASFYVKRRKDLTKPWLWRAFLTSIPLHAAYLAAVFWSDRLIPSLMTKTWGFLPILTIAFAIESIIVDGIVDRFEPKPDRPVRRGPVAT